MKMLKIYLKLLIQTVNIFLLPNPRSGLDKTQRRKIRENFEKNFGFDKISAILVLKTKGPLKIVG